MESRKAAIAAYKEIKPERGVFAMRCSATNSVWVDSTPDLRAAQNRMWSSLRFAGAHTEKTMLAEFEAHGQDTFSFEVLEQLKEDVTPMALKDLLKEKKLQWMSRLGARPISPV
jgi:hypothetical protein